MCEIGLMERACLFAKLSNPKQKSLKSIKHGTTRH